MENSITSRFALLVVCMLFFAKTLHAQIHPQENTIKSELAQHLITPKQVHSGGCFLRDPIKNYLEAVILYKHHFIDVWKSRSTPTKAGKTSSWSSNEITLNLPEALSPEIQELKPFLKALTEITSISFKPVFYKDLSFSNPNNFKNKITGIYLEDSGFNGLRHHGYRQDFMSHVPMCYPFKIKCSNSTITYLEHEKSSLPKYFFLRAFALNTVHFNYGARYNVSGLFFIDKNHHITKSFCEFPNKMKEKTSTYKQNLLKECILRSLGLSEPVYRETNPERSPNIMTAQHENDNFYNHKYQISDIEIEALKLLYKRNIEYIEK